MRPIAGLLLFLYDQKTRRDWTLLILVVYCLLVVVIGLAKARTGRRRRIAIAEPTRRVGGSVWESAKIESGMEVVAMCYCTGANHGRTLNIRKARQGKGGLTLVRERVVNCKLICGPAAAFLMSAPPRSRLGKAATSIASAGLNSTLVDKTSYHPSHQHNCSVLPTRYPPIKSIISSPTHR